jgi:hypothetical protein
MNYKVKVRLIRSKEKSSIHAIFNINLSYLIVSAFKKAQEVAPYEALTAGDKDFHA